MKGNKISRVSMCILARLISRRVMTETELLKMCSGGRNFRPNDNLRRYYKSWINLGFTIRKRILKQASTHGITADKGHIDHKIVIYYLAGSGV